jgi:ketosteroid isomerase-like protein
MQHEHSDRADRVLDRAGIDLWVRTFWRERLENGTAAMQQHTSHDVHFRILGGPPSLPGPWIFDGQQQMIDAVATIDTNLEFLSFEIIDMIIDGSEVALRWHALLRNRGTGESGELSVFDHIVIQNGLITSYTEFLDTEGFRLLMTGEPQPAFARKSNRPAGHFATSRQPLIPPAPAMLTDTASRDRKEKMLRAFWQERVKHGSSALAQFCTQDSEIHLIGDPAAVPFARSHYGLEAASALVDQIDMEFEYLSFEIRKILIDGDRAALQYGADVRHRGTSASGHVEAFDHMVLKDDRIAVFTEFFDTAAAAGWIAG